jgi:hypothetical protein
LLSLGEPHSGEGLLTVTEHLKAQHLARSKRENHTDPCLVPQLASLPPATLDVGEGNHLVARIKHLLMHHVRQVVLPGAPPSTNRRPASRPRSTPGRCGTPPPGPRARETQGYPAGSPGRRTAARSPGSPQTSHCGVSALLDVLGNTRLAALDLLPSPTAVRPTGRLPTRLVSPWASLAHRPSWHRHHQAGTTLSSPGRAIFVPLRARRLRCTTVNHGHSRSLDLGAL